jgi:hypothetical protein
MRSLAAYVRQHVISSGEGANVAWIEILFAMDASHERLVSVMNLPKAADGTASAIRSTLSRIQSGWLWRSLRLTYCCGSEFRFAALINCRRAAPKSGGARNREDE